MSAVGVLEFRYNNFKRLRKDFERRGIYTINLGDSIQTIAVQKIAESVGVEAGNIIRINRDDLPAYSGPPVRLIMNGCFRKHCFPIPKNVQPIFIGFQISNPLLISRHWKYFKAHEPIGCRDTATALRFREQNVDAYVTGCLTMTFPRRTAEPAGRKTIFIGGEGAGKIPGGLMNCVPKEILASAVYLHQRAKAITFPLTDSEVAQAGKIAEGLLATYREEATLVVTPLLHAAGPCLAMGIPVVLARKNYHERFTAISRLLPVYTPDSFSQINWSPQPVHLEELKQNLACLLDNALKGNGPPSEIRHFLTALFEKTDGPTDALHSNHSKPFFWRRLFSSVLGALGKGER